MLPLNFLFAGPGPGRPPHYLHDESLGLGVALPARIKTLWPCFFPGRFDLEKRMLWISLWGPKLPSLPICFSRRSWKFSLCGNLSDFKCWKWIHFGKIVTAGQTKKTFHGPVLRLGPPFCSHCPKGLDLRKPKQGRHPFFCFQMCHSSPWGRKHRIVYLLEQERRAEGRNLGAKH